MKNRCTKSRRISRWYGLNFFNKGEKYLEDSIHNYILWQLSGKLNWIEFYIWIENNKHHRSIIGLFETIGCNKTDLFFQRYENCCEWKNLFIKCSHNLSILDIGFYLDFISKISKYSGFEIYNNHILYIDLIINVLQKPATLFRCP